MLVLARQARGITQAVLSRQVDIAQGTLSKIEQGLRSEIESQLLDKISEVLSFPNDFFLIQGRIFPPHTPFIFRKKLSVKKRQIDKVEAVANIKRIHIAKMLKEVEIDMNVPEFDLDDIGGPEKGAIALRKVWNIPKGPIANMTKLLEDAGCLIIESNFEDNPIDGFSVFDRSSLPIIFISSSLPGDRARFTLAHELGHLVLHTIPTNNMEEEANKFAAEFLMPSSEIKPSLRTSSLRDYANLKPYWKVSIASLIYKAKRLNTITQQQYKYLWMQMSQYGYRLHEPESLDVQKEKPSLLSEIISIFKDGLGYSIDDFCKLFALTKSDVYDFYLYPGIQIQES